MLETLLFAEYLKKINKQYKKNINTHIFVCTAVSRLGYVFQEENGCRECQVVGMGVSHDPKE